MIHIDPIMYMRYWRNLWDLDDAGNLNDHMIFFIIRNKNDFILSAKIFIHIVAGPTSKHEIFSQCWFNAVPASQMYRVSAVRL